jgi:hypothetical protein
MPYKLQETDDGFYVINTETGERKNKKPMPRERANKYMRALYAVEGGAEMGKKETPGLFIFKQSDGTSRWITFSSNAYRDRDSEIVSTAALEADVARADKEGDYGPLRWWHVGQPDPINRLPGSGADIGRCDYNAMHGRILVESGTFINENVAEAITKKASDLQVSIGFFHPKDQPDQSGVFHSVRRFERSLLPRGRASNPWTSMLVIQKEVRPMLKEKLEALRMLLGGDDELVKTVLAAAEKTDHSAEEAGVEFKGENPQPDEPATETKAEEVELIEAEAAGDEEIIAEVEAENLEPVIGDMTREQFAGVMAEALSAAIEPYAKELQAVKQAMTTKDDTIASMREALEAQSKQVKALSAELSELTGSQPRAANKGYRASQAEDTVVKPASTVKGAKPTVDPDFVKFALPGN